MAESLALEKSTNVRSSPWQLTAFRALFRVLCATAPGLAARLAIRLFRTVRPYRRPEREEAWLAEARSFEIEAPPLFGGSPRLAAWSWGEEGPAVLLVHGWEGRGSQMGAFAAPLAARGFRVVTYDAPGHGASGGRLSSLPQFAAGVAAAARSVGPLAGVVAHSFGVAGACYALMNGSLPAEQVARLVFIAPPGDLQRYIAVTAEMLGLSPEVEARFVRLLEERFGVDWGEARHATVRAARETPLLVLHDREDDETPLPDARRVAAAWPRCRFDATIGLGHRRILRHPEVVARAVDFLAGDASRPGEADRASAGT